MRCQPWPMVSLCHGGAYALTDRRGARVLDSSRVFLANPNEDYRASHATGSDSWGSSFAVHADVLLSMAAERRAPAIRRPPGFAVASLPCSARVCLLDRAVLGAVLRRDPDTLAIQEATLSLVAEVLAVGGIGLETDDRESARSPRHRDLVEAVRALLAERVGDALGLEEIARAAAVSPYHLCRVFKESTGETLHRYRNRLRLRTALQPVLDGADLTAVALASGYSSHSHFTAAFRCEFGVAPSRLKGLAARARLPALMRALESFPQSPLSRRRAIT